MIIAPRIIPASSPDVNDFFAGKPEVVGAGVGTRALVVDSLELLAEASPGAPKTAAFVLRRESKSPELTVV